MEDKLMEPIFVEPTEEETLQREFDQKKRDCKRGRIRSAIVRSQIVRAAEILEGIRFDFVSDTAFRDKITRARRSLESAIDDYLMSDKYWEERVDKFWNMKLEDYIKHKNRPTVQESKG